MQINTLYLSDYVIDPLADLLEETVDELSLSPTIAPYGQIRQVVYNENDPAWKKGPTLAVVWTRPEFQITAFARLIAENQWNMQSVIEEVEDYAAAIKHLAEKVKIVIIPKWTLRADYPGNGISDLKNGIGIANMLMRMNIKLIDELANYNNVIFLDTSRWYALAPVADNDRMWYVGKIPYSQGFFKIAAQEIRTTIGALYGKTAKMLVLDLDNTLWGGVIGDDGLGGIRLGGIDPVGEAFVDFQKSILALKNRGFLLSIVSKNEEHIALEVFEKHRDMVLRKNDFVTWRINWNDKARNIADIAKEINIGLDTLVFIDDNPTERDRVKSVLPTVKVPEWPEDPLQYLSALNSLTFFNKASFSREDTIKTEMYQNEKRRKEESSSCTDITAWLHTLQLELAYRRCLPKDVPRALQLLNKTNQFNLCTRRMDEITFYDYLNNPENIVLIFDCKDKFGEYGSIGLASLKMSKSEQEIQLNDFLMSCRSMGKEVEFSMMAVVAQLAQDQKYSKIKAAYHPTDRNMVCADFLDRCRFIKKSANVYINENINDFQPPDHISIIE